MNATMFGKITNEHGEMVAEGDCEVDEARGSVTLRPLYDMPLLERQHGNLRLVLDDGSEIVLTDRVLRFRVNYPGRPPASLYKMYVAGHQTMPYWYREPSPNDPGPPRDPDKVPPDLHNDPPPPEWRR